ncbi:serine hydrolase [Pseudorhodoferax sp.]|uniref:serine hydrolase n=1 Tax=Pseudorhodoferax sp. TaxID=1993553 RepID=UPI002DD65033|nr:serine hydrolase [Pseudorhodoferax sp.]
MKSFITLLAGLALALSAQAGSTLRFVFGAGPVQAGEQLVGPATRYTPERGHGFEEEAPAATTQAVAGPRRGHAVLAPQRALHFSVDLPEGSYRVSVTLGGSAQASDTSLRAEVRRLLLQGARTAAREARTEVFSVHVRRPVFPGGQVRLRAPRESTQEAWNWDGRLTLEINGRQPVLQALQIERVDKLPLIFLLGDSTVADQSGEPYASWGQQLPRFVAPSAAVVSLAQSGESYRDSLQRRRLDKIISLGQPGDLVLMQYGHNDQKQLRDGSGSVASYQDEIRQHVRALQAAQMKPVIVTSVERRFFEPDGSLRWTLKDHVDAAKAVAAEFKLPVIDLNAASRQLYLQLGPQQAESLFAKPADGKVDPTHHNGDGAWQLAAMVAQALREQKLTPHLRAAPPAQEAEQLPPSPGISTQRPLGDEIHAASGWSQERLGRLDAAIQDEIARQRLAGAVTVLLRDGKLVHQGVHGLSDIENRQPMRADTLFRIASMSKAVTTIAAMMLYEEGRFLLRDPVSRWIPAFGPMQVMNAAGQLEKPRRAITVRDLLLHSAGLSYGAGPAAAAWKAAGFSDWYLLHLDETLAQWTERLAQLPLQGQPGVAFQYGYSTDVLGRLVEIWSGMPLERFVAERIAAPLKLADTFFWVPADKVQRLANVYALDAKGRLQLAETAARSDFVNGPRKLASGGAGLVSTAGDYARLLQMLLNGGQLDGQRLLAPATVALMQRPHLGPGYGADGEGAGFGFWVASNPGSNSELASPGSYGWGSAYSPQYVVDPQQRTVFVYMAQLRPAGDSTINQRVKVLARQALLE